MEKTSHSSFRSAIHLNLCVVKTFHWLSRRLWILWVSFSSEVAVIILTKCGFQPNWLSKLLSSSSFFPLHKPSVKFQHMLFFKSVEAAGERLHGDGSALFFLPIGVWRIYPVHLRFHILNFKVHQLSHMQSRNNIFAILYPQGSWLFSISWTWNCHTPYYQRLLYPPLF